MSLRYIAPLATAAAAATIGLAPVAAAAPSGPITQCTSTGNSTVCQRPATLVSSARRRRFPPAVPVPPHSVPPCSSATADSGNGAESPSACRVFRP